MTPMLPFYAFVGAVIGILGASALVVHLVVVYRRLVKGEKHAHSKTAS